MRSSSSSSSSSPILKSVHSFEKDSSLYLFLASNNSNDDNDPIAESSSSPSLSPFILSPYDSESDPIGKVVIDANSSSSESYLEVTESIAARIEAHYALENDGNQFVGGMGENDGGVWFVSSKGDYWDTLDHWQLIRDVVHKVRQNRHGIPFGLLTSGRTQTPEPDYASAELATKLRYEIGLSSAEVTLGTGDPVSYGQLSGLKGEEANRAFGEVCNFIVLAAESGFPVRVAVAGGVHAGPGQSLAKACGAVDVTVYHDYK